MRLAHPGETCALIYFYLAAPELLENLPLHAAEHHSGDGLALLGKDKDAPLQFSLDEVAHKVVVVGQEKAHVEPALHARIGSLCADVVAN